MLKKLGLPAAATKASTQSPLDRQIQQVLQTLQKQLAAAPSQQASLKALSSAQGQLQKIASGAAQAKSATQGMANALQQQGSTQPLANALQSGNAAATRQALQALSKQITSMSAQQRAATARALEQAANEAPGALKQSLRQAAFN